MKKRVIHPEVFVDWNDPSRYKHVTQEILNEIEDAKVLTSKRCADPGKTVIARDRLVELINGYLEERGHDMNEREVCFKTLSQFALMLSSQFEYHLTISSPSRAVYILVENGAAAHLVDYALSNPGLTAQAREKALQAMNKGRKAATKARRAGRV